MTPPRPDDQPRELRRLPKRAGDAAASGPDASPPRYREEAQPFRPEPRSELYFEALPDPWIDEVEAHSAQVLDSSGRDTQSAFAAPPTETEPDLRFRHSRPDNRTTDAPTWQSAVRAVGAYRAPIPPAPSGPEADTVPPPPPTQRTSPSAEAAATRPSSERPSGRLRQSSGEMPVAPRSSHGDPKPAARLSSVTRSRPARPSGQFTAAGNSGEFAAARSSGSVPVARASGTFAVARTADDTSAAPERTSERLSQTVNAAGHDDADDATAILRDNKLAVPRKQGGDKGKLIAGMVVASAALVAYAFEIGALESAADATAGRLATGGTVIMGLLPWLLVLPALLLFGLIVWLLAGIIGVRRPRSKARRQCAGKQPKSPLNQFKDAALRQGVDNRTAYRGWRLLEAACDGDVTLTVDSNLTDDLGLSPREVRALHLQLLTELSRNSDPAMRLPDAQTVLELLKAVEAAPMARVSTASGEVVIPGDPGQRKRKTASSS